MNEELQHSFKSLPELNQFAFDSTVAATQNLVNTSVNFEVNPLKELCEQYDSLRCTLIEKRIAYADEVASLGNGCVDSVSPSSGQIDDNRQSSEDNESDVSILAICMELLSIFL